MKLVVEFPNADTLLDFTDVVKEESHFKYDGLKAFVNIHPDTPIRVLNSVITVLADYGNAYVIAKDDAEMKAYTERHKDEIQSIAIVKHAP